MTDSSPCAPARPARAHITYDVESGGAIEKKELPFIVGIFADLTGQTGHRHDDGGLGKRRFLDIDRANVDALRAQFGPCSPAADDTWRSLHSLVMNTATGPMLHLRVFNASMDALREDLQQAGGLEQSVLFKRVIEEPAGVFGEAPYGLLVCGYPIGAGKNDIAFLARVAQLAARANCVCIVNAAPSPRGCEPGAPDAFWASGEARLVALAGPGTVAGIDPAFALAESITQAFGTHNWPVPDRLAGAETLAPMLAASRFAHYIKVIMRDKIGSFLTRSNVENYLNTWLSNYVLAEDNAPDRLKASYPLRAASAALTDVPGQPGAYRAVLFIKPHFRLDAPAGAIRLDLELPAQAAGA